MKVDAQISFFWLFIFHLIYKVFYIFKNVDAVLDHLDAAIA